MRKTVLSKQKTQNGGVLYVVEDTGESTEFFEDVDFYMCAHGHRFYVGN